MSEPSNHESVLPPLGAETTHEGADLRAFYADRPKMWRNILWITIGHFGMSLAMTILEPLMNLRLKAVGVSELYDWPPCLGKSLGGELLGDVLLMEE